jgi:hypothetical protein
MNLEQVVEAWKKAWPTIVAKAWLDEQFHERLQKEPAVVLGEHQIPELRGVQTQVVSAEMLKKATLRLSPDWQPSAQGTAARPQVDWDLNDLEELADIQVQKIPGTTSPLLLLPLPERPQALAEPFPVVSKSGRFTIACC